MKPFPHDSILITSFDLKRLFFRVLPQLKICAFLLFFLTGCFFTFREPQYLAKATFKHLDKQSDFSPFTKEIFKELSLSSNNAPIFSVMHSHEVLKNTIEDLGMQVIVSPSLADRLKRVVKNIKSELGRKPSDPDPFCFRHVQFEGEKPLKLYVRKISADGFDILNAQKKIIGQGKLGYKVTLQDCAWELHAFPNTVVQNKLYPFQIIPWISAVEQVRKSFEIRSHKLDKNVFTLYFQHADRRHASQFLNQVMRCYQEYYRQENEEICETQVAYLEKRQDELIKQFDSALKEHVIYLKKNIPESGCIGFSNELDLLAEPQNLFNSKLFDVDLELKRLESLYAHALLAPEEKKNPSKNVEKQQKTIHHSSLRENIEQTLLDHDMEEKRLPINENDILDCDALTLQSAKALYLQYTEKKDASEAQLRERIFLRDRLDKPDFELSSLSTFLNDPVSVSLAQHASAIALKLKDGENRTAREQERLKEELDTQKRFLHQHLTHMIELEKLQIRLLSHKIDSLQQQTRNLLDAEKHLLQEKLAELNLKMSSLPEKWHRENLLLLKKELGSRIIGSMTQLVETKNLHQKLYQVSSKHLDLSVPPLKPLPPHLFLYSLLSAFLGCFIYYLYKLCAQLIQGFPVSHANLKYSGLTSYGVLSPHCSRIVQHLEEKDLMTLRSLAQCISSMPTPQCIALLCGRNPDYSTNLAELLSFSGKKILLLRYPLEKNEMFDITPSPGLFSYLQGKDKEIPIQHHPTFDELASGGNWHHAADALPHPQFARLLADFKKKYDIILIQSNATVHRGEAFTSIADALIISTCDESQEDLLTYRQWAEKKPSCCLAFVCFEGIT